MNVYGILPKPFFALAPMDDVTDTVFRRIIAKCARPDIFFTEFVNVDGLQSAGRQHLLKRIQFTPAERPIIAQLWGKDPENYRKTADELVGMGFAGIDINMGCPDRAVIKNGCGSALIKNHDAAGAIIAATKQGAAGRVPVSVKTRLGFDAVDMGWFEYLFAQGLDMVTVHGRTKKEMSDVPARWDLIGEVVRLRDHLSPGTLVVGNGDAESRTHGVRLAAEYGVDGVMIGRGALHDPFAFAPASPWPDYTYQQRVALFAEHVRLFIKTWTPKDRAVATLNKFAKLYLSDFDGAKDLREQVFDKTSPAELLALLDSLS